MRKILLACLLILLISCMNITEEIFFENDESGLWTMKVDFIKMIELLTMDDEELFKGINWKKGVDIIIDLKEFQDADWDISEMNTDALKNMQVNMNLNSDEEIAVLYMEYPFSTLEDLNRVLVDLNRDMSGEALFRQDHWGWVERLVEKK